MKRTAQDILNFVEDNDVKFAKLTFCDIVGNQKNVSLFASELPRAFAEGVSFDGSSIAGFMNVEESDLVLWPDPDTATVLPWRPTEGRVIRMYCDITLPNGKPFEGNCRGYLQSVVKRARAMGLICNVGCECEFYLFETDENGNPTGEVTPKPTDKDRAVTGCAQPKLTLGWNNDFRYKNWNLSMFFNGVFGTQAYNSARAHYTAAQMFSDGKNVLKEFLDFPVGDSTSSLPSDRYIENASFLRLQSLSLSYTFNNFGEWIKSLQLYLTCNNVFTITNYKGLDPEVNLGGLAPGVDFRWSTYPHTRTVMLGAKINF